MSVITGLPAGVIFEPSMLEKVDVVKWKSPAEVAQEYFTHQKKYPFVLIKDEDDEVVALDGWEFVFCLPSFEHKRYDNDNKIKEIYYCIMCKNNEVTEYNYICSQEELNKKSNSKILIENALDRDVYRAFSNYVRGLDSYHGYLNEDGCGPKGLASAINYFQSAALLIPHAAATLADMYFNGFSDALASESEAINWYLHAGNRSIDIQLIVHCAVRLLQKQIGDGFNLLLKAAENLDPVTKNKNFYGIAFLIYYFENLDVKSDESRNMLLMTARKYREQLPTHLREASGSELIQTYCNLTGLSLKQATLNHEEFAR